MDFEDIFKQINGEKQAGFCYEKEGNGRFRDVLTICRNKTCVFERFCYGEAAGIVFQAMGSISESEPNCLNWQLEDSCYSDKNDVPLRLIKIENNDLFFDNKPIKWCLKDKIKKLKYKNSRKLFGFLRI